MALDRLTSMSWTARRIGRRAGGLSGRAGRTAGGCRCAGRLDRFADAGLIEPPTLPHRLGLHERPHDSSALLVLGTCASLSRPASSPRRRSPLSSAAAQILASTSASASSSSGLLAARGCKHLRACTAAGIQQTETSAGGLVLRGAAASRQSRNPREGRPQGSRWRCSPVSKSRTASRCCWIRPGGEA